MINTIQSKAVIEALNTLGHATNLELHGQVVKQLPDLSATTVHRITTRLIEDKQIGLAPSNGKAVVLDARPEPHEHFVCKSCGDMRDIALPDSVFDSIQEQLGKNIVSNGLVICGVCAACSEEVAPMS